MSDRRLGGGRSGRVGTARQDEATIATTTSSASRRSWRPRSTEARRRRTHGSGPDRRADADRANLAAEAGTGARRDRRAGVACRGRRLERRIERPYFAAIARWREAEACLANGDRAGASHRGAGRARNRDTPGRACRCSSPSRPSRVGRASRLGRCRRRRDGRDPGGDRSVRADAARTRGPGAARRRPDEPSDRRRTCSSARARPASTCRTSSASSARRIASKRPRSRFGSAASLTRPPEDDGVPIARCHEIATAARARAARP